MYMTIIHLRKKEEKLLKVKYQPMTLTPDLGQVHNTRDGVKDVFMDPHTPLH